MQLGQQLVAEGLLGLINYKNQSDDFKNAKGWTHCFSDNVNVHPELRRTINNRPKRQVEARSKWVQQSAMANGQFLKHQRICWNVAKLLSTVSLVICDWEKQVVYYDVYRVNSDKAVALMDFGILNNCFGDWTSREPISSGVGQLRSQSR